MPTIEVGAGVRRLVDNAYVLLPLSALAWAGNHTVGRLIVGEVPPGGMAVARWVLAALVLAPFAWKHLTRDLRQIRGHFPAVLFLAITGAASFGTLQFVALQYAPALNMSVLNSIAPMMILVASFLLFQDRIRLGQAIGVAVSLAGVLVIIAKADPANLWALAFDRGDLFILFNMMLWSIYCACLRLRPPVHWLSFLLVVAVISAIANVPFWVWEHINGLPLKPTLATAATVGYVGILNSVLAYAAWNRGVELIGAPRASAFLHLIPVFGAILAGTILGEQLQFYHVAAFAIILTGVTLAARQPRRSA